MPFLPEAKKKLSAFLQDEKGSIPKQSLLSLGSVLTAATFTSLMSGEGYANNDHSSGNGCSNDHQNNMQLRYDQSVSRITATHKHYDSAHSSSHANS